MPAPRSTPGVLVFRVFVPGTCTLSWVSTRVFFSHLDPSTTRIQSQCPVPQKSRPSYVKKRTQAKKGGKKRSTLLATSYRLPSSRGLYVRRSSSVILTRCSKKDFYVFVKLFFLVFFAFWNSTFIAHTRAV